MISQTMIRVGRCIYDKKGKKTDPAYPGFTNILVLTKSRSEWGVLGPYELKDEEGRIMENIWQFSKIYTQVPRSVRHYSRYNQTIIWDHPAETHIDSDGDITEEYWKWRTKGFNNKYSVRYPVGFHNMKDCQYALKESDVINWNLRKLDYVTARKEIYCPVYMELARAQPKFQELKAKLESGENLLIIEVDGPHQESLEYYMETYGVKRNFIERDTMEVTLDNLKVMLNDATHPFGHGYCLAIALMDLDEVLEDNKEDNKEDEDEDVIDV